MWGKEVRREREREIEGGGGGCSNQRTSQTLQVNEGCSRDPEALRPDSCTQTDGQAEGQTNNKTYNILIELEMAWREVSMLFYCLCL